jgi:hypothetical protein
MDVPRNQAFEHFAVLLIHIPFIVLEYKGRHPLFGLDPERRILFGVFSMLLLNVLQATLHGLNLRYNHVLHVVCDSQLVRVDAFLNAMDQEDCIGMYGA